MLQQDDDVKHAEPLTQQQKLELVMEVAAQIGRRYGIDPTELWAGWLAVKVAEAGWDGVRPMMNYMRVSVRGLMLNSMKKVGISVINLPL